MAQGSGKKLDSGEAFPDLDLQLLDGGTKRVSALMQGKYGVLLIYRGHW